MRAEGTLPKFQKWLFDSFGEVGDNVHSLVLFDSFSEVGDIVHSLALPNVGEVSKNAIHFPTLGVGASL